METVDLELAAPTDFGQGRFVVERMIGRGSTGVVYQTFDKERCMRVALKTLRNMTTESLYRLKREFRGLHDIVHPNLCSLMELIKDEEVWFLTMELIDGVDFLSYVKNTDLISGPDSRGQPSFDEKRLRKSLAGLCCGLNALHAAGKVHRDIKPSNVMVGRDGRVVLLDFGLIAEREIGQQREEGHIIGTAAYMAPEQAESTALGPEADWYSVGTILYEALTGQLPFEGSPAKMLLDKQVSDPVRPGEIKAGLPKDLEKLCSDLLLRDPKSRVNPSDYLVLMDAYSKKSVHPQWLGVTEFTQGELFVGRDAELKLIGNLFAEVVNGSFETVVVEGVSGVGKSTLVNHFSAGLRSADESVVVLNGRCYEHESAPFKAFDGVVECFVQHLRTISARQARDLRTRHPELLIRLFPALKRADLFANEPGPEIEIEGPHELQRRSFEAFGELLSALGGQRPLIVVLDDMQWADSDSLSLLKFLSRKEFAPNMLLVILSRYVDLSCQSAWNWESVVTGPVRRIHLKPLSISESTELTRMFMNLENNVVDVNPELIAEEGDGHPMYIAELVHHLASNRKEQWKNLSLDEAIWQRVKLCPDRAIEILKLVCVAGAPMNRDYVQQLVAVRSEEFHQYISLLRAGRFIKSRRLGSIQVVEPYHDRVRESVLKQVNGTGMAATIHLTIGQFLLSIYSSIEVENDIFTVVRHLHAGRELIESESEKLRLAELYFIAGRRAKTDAAYASSLLFFKKTIELADAVQDSCKRELMLNAYTEGAEVAFLCAEQNTMERYCAAAMDLTNDVLAKVRIYEIRIQAYTSWEKHLESIRLAKEALRILGVHYPQKVTKLSVIDQLLKVKLAFKLRAMTDLKDLPLIEDPFKLATMRIMLRLSTAAYFTSDELFAYNGLRTVRYSLKHGNAAESISAYGLYAIILSNKLRKYEEGYQVGKMALELTKKIESKRHRARALFQFNSYVRAWIDDIHLSREPLVESFQTALAVGDTEIASYPAFTYCALSLLLCGTPLEKLEKEIVYYSEVLRKIGHEKSLSIILIFRQVAYNLVHSSPTPARLNGEYAREEEFAKRYLQKENRFSIFVIYLCAACLAFLYEDTKHAVVVIRKMEEYERGLESNLLSQLLNQMYCLVYLRALPELDKSEKKRALARVDRAVAQLKKWEKHCATNLAYRTRLVQAEIARVGGRVDEACTYYRAAIGEARDRMFLDGEALAWELFGRFALERVDEELAEQHLRRAFHAYRHWGALAKAEHLRKNYPQFSFEGIEVRG